jgi:hypothetical protein
MSKPWLKSWTCSLRKRKVMSLPGDLFKVWQILQWVAADHDKDGALPSLDDCAYTMRKDEEWLLPLVAQLVERELIDKVGDEYRMHDWDEWQVRKPSDEPDAVLARVRKHRGQPSPDVTPRNALQSVTDVVTPSNARNAVKTRLEEKREEKEEKRGEGSAPATRATRMPDSFVVDESMDEWAFDKGMSDEFVAKHTEAFVLTFRANGNTMKNWRARWQKWMLDAQENGGQYKKRA